MRLFATAALLLFAIPTTAQPPESRMVRQIQFESYMSAPVTCDASAKGVTYLHSDGKLRTCTGTEWNTSDDVLSDLSDVCATSPSSGEVLEWNGSAWCPATDDTGGGGFNCLGDYIRVSANAQNINAAATDNLVTWDVTAVGDNGSTFTHSTSTNPSRVEVETTARYQASVVLSFNTTGQRYNGAVKVRVNGSAVQPYRGKSGYIRSASGHNEASLTLPAFTLELSANDYIEVLVDREAITAAANLNAGESFLELRCAD